MKKRIAVLITSLLLLFLAACGNTEETAKESSGGEGEEAKKITVAVVNDYPPFEYVEDGELVGFDVDIINEIAKQENLEVEWKVMKFDGIIPALQAKQVDAAVSAITIRDDRAEVVDFSNPYFESGLSLVVAKDSPIKSIDDLQGKNIVAKQGTSGLMKAKELAEKYDGKTKTLQDDVSLYLEVESGNSDAMVNDFPSVAYKLKTEGDNAKLKIVGEKLTGEDYGIAVVKGNKELLDKMNNGLKSLKDSGKYQEIFDKYFTE